MSSAAKYLEFVPLGSSESGMTESWEMRVTKGLKQTVGSVKWDADGMKYAYRPEHPTFRYDEQTLRKIALFIEAHTRKHWGIAPGIDL